MSKPKRTRPILISSGLSVGGQTDQGGDGVVRGINLEEGVQSVSALNYMFITEQLFCLIMSNHWLLVIKRLKIIDLLFLISFQQWGGSAVSSEGQVWEECSRKRPVSPNKCSAASGWSKNLSYAVRMGGEICLSDIFVGPFFILWECSYF